MNEEVRRTLLWLAERVDLAIGMAMGETRIPPHPHRMSMTAAPCGTCGHDRTAHVVGGDADNPTPWPCEYPKVLSAPVALCTCPDYQSITGD